MLQRNKLEKKWSTVRSSHRQMKPSYVASAVMICKDLFHATAGVGLFLNRKCEVVNQQCDPETPSLGDCTGADGTPGCISVGVWILNMYAS